MQLGGSLHSHFKDKDLKNTMNQIATSHNTPTSETEMCGFGCVQGMNASLAVFDCNRASLAQAKSW